MRASLLLATLALLAATPARAAEPAKAAPPVAVKVTMDGFEPARIPAVKGKPVTLVVTRTTDRTCATEIVVKEYGINTPLPLNKPVTVTFTPKKAGEVKFACAMDMIGGVVVVQ